MGEALIRIKKEMSFGVFMYVCDSQKKILMVKHDYGDKKWSLPGGGLEQGELVNHGAEREVNEETGLNVKASELYGVYSLRKSAGIVMLFVGEVTDENYNTKPDPKEISESKFLYYEDILAMASDVYPAQMGLIQKARESDFNVWAPYFDWVIPPVK